MGEHDRDELPRPQKGAIDLIGAGSATTKTYMVHWQLHGVVSPFNWVMSMPGGAQYIVPGKRDVQDVVAVVVLPEPINKPWAMMGLTIDIPQPFNFIGVEVTPM